MDGKVVATNLNGEIMIFDSKEEYEENQAKVMVEIFNNAFTNNYKDGASTD